MTDHPVKWGDAQQYEAEPHSGYQGEERGVMPTVHLLWMTPDPLGAVAAMAEMYKGNVIRSLSDVTDDMRRSAWEDVQKTHLKAPLEAVKVHFMIEGVDRAFTHQHVRQRTAVFAQESMRFAIPGKLTEATTLPPSLQGTTDQRMEGDPSVTRDWAPNQHWRNIWENALNTVDAAYHMLVDSGMPAEEARGLLPHCTATRLNYITDLRNLSDHAGNRLCTQAQFHWRLVFAQIVQAIRDHGNNDDNCHTLLDGDCVGTGLCMHSEDRWQYEAIATSSLFRPVCYQLGHCPFQASFDRACTIRQRVEFNAKNGIPSSQWDEEQSDGITYVTAPIKNEEWLLNPGAARA